jgi:F-type H+-transporting ATPase subunit gamma
VEREQVKRIGYIIVSTDRGLCGGLNSVLFRKLLADMREWQGKGVEVDVVCIGQKATTFFRRLKVNLLGSVTHLGEKPEIEKLVGVIKVMLDGYSEGRLDRVFLTYNDFINTMTQKPRQDQLLPLPASDTLESRHDWDYLYEPDAQAVLDHVLTRYVESLVYQSTLENLASEHAARMVAMKSASDNATKLIGTLNLIYNKARQAAITQEISEIVGGAAAV